MTPEQAQEELFRRKRARDDLLEFTKFTHPKWAERDHHTVIAHRLQQLEVRAPMACCGQPLESLAIFAPPRSGKTELSTRRYAAWIMGRNPGWHVISAMATTDLAQHTGGDVRDIVASREYQAVFPKMRLKTDAKAARRWIVEKGNIQGVYFCGGMDSTFPGRGANCLIIDDPHKSAQEADSSHMRNLVARTYYHDLIHRLESPYRQVLTNTRRHEDDLAGRLLTPTKKWKASDGPNFFCCGNGWHVLRLRAIENEGAPYPVAMRTQRIADDEDPLDHMHKLRDWYVAQGESRSWWSEFQQEPVAEEGLFIKRAWFADRYIDVPDGLWIYGASDVAITEDNHNKKEPDFTEHCIFGLSGVKTEEGKTDDGKTTLRVTADAIWFLDWWYGQRESVDWCDEQIRMIKEWRPAVWFSTKGMIMKATKGFIEREIARERAWVQLEWLDDIKQKAVKGYMFKVMAAQGRVHLPQLEWADRLINQAVKVLGGGSKDDAFDCAANACRAMNEMPALFAAAPVTEKPERDVYEDLIDPNAHNRWRTL